jgi:hypothetical protein
LPPSSYFSYFSELQAVAAIATIPTEAPAVIVKVINQWLASSSSFYFSSSLEVDLPIFLLLGATFFCFHCLHP